ncbi:hypothetical protein F3Y22_tig00111002pilonHSYRG00100 [Hibiscus syriacus]|uniref:Uncharacterized protein n=1 Tax=Hibiscus syriacus TaxID=106335 RepID=A0A6A2ZAD7_HIBSY|nr:hypothetical protein F3Y22_tig00111002pilonHSYRG00100 [Hibiscus syriacus]
MMGSAKALQGPTALPTEMPEKERNNILDKDLSMIILSLGDKVLREVPSETTSQTLYTKLEFLYMTKSLANRLFLKQRQYSFKMHKEESISEQIDEFNKIIYNLENIDVKMEDEDKALMLLNSIPKSYEHFKDAMLYGRVQTISIEEVQSLIRAKELQKKHDMNEENSGDGGHFKKNCPDRKKKYQEKPKDSGEVSVVSDGYDSTKPLVITESESSKEWILDSSCSFYMCPHEDWFETLQLVSGRSILLGDNKACRVVGRGIIIIRMFDGAERILQHVRKNGITGHKIVQNTPHQNGLAERMNRTLLERVTCMLLNIGLPKSFWGEVVSTAYYLINRQDNLEARALRCIFIGYPLGTTGYKLWCIEPGQQKCIISRDMVFDESKMANLQSYVTKNNVTNEDIPIEVELQQQQTVADQGTGVNYQDGEVEIHQETKPDTKFDDYNLVEPKNYMEALKSKERHKWADAVDEEIDALMKNKTWELVDRPKNQRVVGCKWIFKKNEGIPSVEKARMILALVAQYHLELEQLDVKTAFLHGELEQTIYMDQPDGYVTLETKDKVCLLRKSLYGLKQNPRQWYKRFDEFMLRIGFARSSYDSFIYMKKQDGEISTYLLLYVDDILVARRSKEKVQKIKGMLNSEFDMKDLGATTKILGMETIIDRKKNSLFFSQNSYIQKVLVRFNMQEASRFMANPGKAHWEALKWTLRYLRGSIDTRKSLTGFIFTVFEAIQEAMWLKGMVEELGLQQKVVTVFCDNQSTIHLTRNQVFHERSKHIDVKLYFVRDVIAKGSIIVKKMPTKENPADMLTKALPAAKFRHCLDLVNSTEK